VLVLVTVWSKEDTGAADLWASACLVFWRLFAQPHRFLPVLSPASGGNGDSGMDNCGQVA
jgi:hypothetical protein